MILLLATLAHAQALPEEPAHVLHQKVTTIDFTSLNVNALPDKPTEILVIETKHQKGPSFIKLREDFNDELGDSADEVR